MTRQEARGVQLLEQLVQDFSRLDSVGAKAIVDGLTDQDLSDIAKTAAGAASTLGERDVITESFADRMDRSDTQETRQ